MSEQNPDSQPPTTTHSRWGAGSPRLVIYQGNDYSFFPLSNQTVRIGSASDSDIAVSRADPLHAEVNHDDRDEYVLTLRGLGEMNADPKSAATGGDDRSEILRTGARFTIADYTFVFMRDEYADHGRPYGGRQGGELSEQPTQPERPDYSDQKGVEQQRKDEPSPLG